MAEITLTATPRPVHGTRPSRRLRAEGKVPGVVYGVGGAPVPVTVVWRELRAALVTDQGLNAVIHLDVDGEVAPTLVKELQRHPVRRDVIHVDFLRVDLSKPVDADVPIHLEGEAIEVLRTTGGVVDQVLTSLTISAKPDQIPAQLVVDVSGLQVGDTIRVGDLALPAGVVTAVDPDEAVVTTSVVFADVPEGGAAGEGGEGGEAPAAGGSEGDAEGGDAEG
ncbi:MAG: 50S ribosomal protein L25 [Acidimicrobiia bacterium]